jgi:hypothetical protein
LDGLSLDGIASSSLEWPHKTQTKGGNVSPNIATFKPKNVIRVRNKQVVEVSDECLVNQDVGSTSVTREGDTFTCDIFDPEHGGVPRRSGDIAAALAGFHPSIASKYNLAFAMTNPTEATLLDIFPGYKVIFE